MCVKPRHMASSNQLLPLSLHNLLGFMAPSCSLPPLLFNVVDRSGCSVDRSVDITNGGPVSGDADKLLNVDDSRSVDRSVDVGG